MAANHGKRKEDHGFSDIHMQGLRTANGSKKFVDFLVFDKPIIDKEAEIFVLKTKSSSGFVMKPASTINLASTPLLTPSMDL